MKTLLLAVALFVASFVYANPDTPPHGPFKQQLMDELKLTDEQQEQFKKISFDVQKKQIELRSKLATARLELRRLMDADTPDKAAIEKKFNEIAATQTAMKMNRYNGWLEKNKVLTPEQQKIWKKALFHHLNAPRKHLRALHDGMPARMNRHPMMRRNQP